MNSVHVQTREYGLVFTVSKSLFFNLAVVRKVKKGREIGSQDWGALLNITPFFQTHYPTAFMALMSFNSTEKNEIRQEILATLLHRLKESSSLTRQMGFSRNERYCFQCSLIYIQAISTVGYCLKELYLTSYLVTTSCMLF